MELGTILVVAYLALWGLGKLFGGGNKPRRVPDLQRVPHSGGNKVGSRPQTIEDLLAEMQRAAGQGGAGEPRGRTKEPDQLPAEFDQPAEVFDEEFVDFGEQSRKAAARRLVEAEARNRGLNAEDYRRFQKQINRKAVIAKPRIDPEYQARLRSAFIWHEIIDKPVSMRGE